MRFGVYVFVLDTGLSPGEAAVTAEAAGLSSIYVGDHSHFPREDPAEVDPATRPQNTERYSQFIDQFVALATMAEATSEIRIGSGICLVPLREPLLLAKQVASVDHLSGGRLDFGIGAGWNLEEIVNHGIDPDRRFARMREHVLAMKELWTQDVAAFDGEYVSFSEAMSWPKPVQSPHPPIIVGGRGPKVFDRVFEYGDAWGPDVVGGIAAIEELRPRAEEFVARRSEVGREEAKLVAYGAEIDEACVEALTEIGFDEIVFWTDPGDAGEVTAAIERAAELARAYRS
jgi:probable F420-dependent oxidoreductase